MERRGYGTGERTVSRCGTGTGFTSPEGKYMVLRNIYLTNTAFGFILVVICNP
jgi:hypothetical protein